MEDKLPKNPKYDEVKGKLDTGPTVKKVVVLSKFALIQVIIMLRKEERKSSIVSTRMDWQIY